MTSVMAEKGAHGTRGDGVSAAGRSLTGLLTYRRQYSTTRTVLTVMAVLLAVTMLAAVVWAVVVDPYAFVIVLVAALLAAVGRYVATTHGASILLASTFAAGAVVVWISVASDLGVWPVLAAAAGLGLTGTHLCARTRHLPVTPAAVVCHWLMVAALFAVPWVGVAAVWAAVAIIVVVTAIQLDLPGYVRFVSAARRSRIPVLRTRMRRRTVGLRAPAMMSEDNIAHGLEAEQATAEVLDTLGPQYVVLHSRCVPGSNADIDHLIVGPHGVAVVDSKYRTGSLELRDRAVSCDSEQVRVRAEHVRCEAPDQCEDVPDESLSSAEISSRHHNYDILAADFYQCETWPEWYLNGRPANASLMSAVAWETWMVEQALVVPSGNSLPVAVAVYGARMSDEQAVVVAFADNGAQPRAVSTVHYSAIADWVRGLPAIIGDGQMVADLAVVVDYLFPRK